MIRLALLRHGHTHWNREGRIQGRTDVPLDDLAVAELSQRSLPLPWHKATIVASPLIRAVKTAQLVSGVSPHLVPDLIEMDWGEWEGQKAAELHATKAVDYRAIEDWGWEYAAPHGESPESVRKRVLPWVLGLHQDTLAVTHIGIMRVILALATGWHFSGPPPFQIKRNRLYIIEVKGGRLSLQPDTLALNRNDR